MQPLKCGLVVALLLVLCACSDSTSTNSDGGVDDQGSDQMSGDLSTSDDQSLAKPDAPAHQEKTVQAGGGVNLHVHIAGDPTAGDVVIGIHGGPGMSSDYMASLDSLADLASGTLAVVRYDQRGVGRSTKPTSDAYGLLEYVADLEAVRQAVAENDSVHILGHSWGGLIAMAYAAVHSENVKSLALMGSAAPTGADMLEANARFTQRMNQLQQQGVVPDPLPPQSDPGYFDALLPVYFHDPTFLPPDELKGIEVDGEVSQKTWGTIGSSVFDLTKEAATITGPALLLFGQGDPFGLQMGQATKEALTAAQVTWAELVACGHFWQECAQAFFGQLRDYYQLDR